MELGRDRAKALQVLNRLGDLGESAAHHAPPCSWAGQLDALDKFVEADDAYSWAADRYAGLEASARYAVFLNRTGRKDEAHDILTELDKRLAKTQPHLTEDLNDWREFYAAACYPSIPFATPPKTC